MNEVSLDDLEPSEDHTVLEYQGNPFTGLAVEFDSANRRVAEVPYVDGQRSGIANEWSRTGQLLSERGFLLNSLHGAVHAWFEDGRDKCKATYELGICTAKQEWNALGELVADYQLTESDPQFKTLVWLRKLYARPQP
jgi:antitoxin component YwqK of YwqJK toxin-antitoxin module